MHKRPVISIVITGIVLCFFLNAEAVSPAALHSPPADAGLRSRPVADEGYPYGRSRSGRYGEKRAILNEEEVRNVLREYFHDDVTIEDVKENKFYFEAEIRNKKGDLIDKVIIDRRSGRMRSVF